MADILRQTPDIPANCQWGIFLRNHDELTLEMVTDKERDYLWNVYAADRRGAAQSRHPAPAGAADGQRPAQDRADEQPAAVDAGHADHLLRRRDRHGRQHLPRRPRRRAHADAVVARPQRRLLARRSRAAVSAADHGRDLRLRCGQRRGAAARPVVPAELDEAADRGAPGASGVRPRHAAPALSAQPQDPGLSARARGRQHPVRGQPGALRAGGRARSRRVPRAGCRSSCSGAARSRRSAICPTC